MGFKSYKLQGVGSFSSLRLTVGLGGVKGSRFVRLLWGSLKDAKGFLGLKHQGSLGGSPTA